MNINGKDYTLDFFVGSDYKVYSGDIGMILLYGKIAVYLQFLLLMMGMNKASSTYYACYGVQLIVIAGNYY